MSRRDGSPPPRGSADRRPAMTRGDRDERTTQDRAWKDRDPDQSTRNDRERNRRTNTALSNERNRKPETTLSGDRERPRNRESALSADRERPRNRETTSSNDRERSRNRETTSSNDRDRKSDSTPSSDRERTRNRETTSSKDRERNRKGETTSSKDRERNRRGETTSSKDREKDKNSEATPSRKPEVLEKTQKSDQKQKNSDPTPANDSEKQKKTLPTPSNVPKKPDPPQSLVQGVVPERIRRSVYVLKDYLPIKDREPVIGLEYIMEYRVQIREARVEIKYFCELCVMDSGVVPMLDHVCGFKHRKMYVTKKYPFVLKALFSNKEDRALFMRRMAVEIEEEEGIKMYKSDPVVRMVSMMNVQSTEAKKSKRKTRWDTEGERQKKMKQALKVLDSFVIRDDNEAATVTKLLQKVTSIVKFHTDKLKEQAIFPLKVARAQIVATTMVKNAIRARLAEQNIFPLLELGNISLHTLGRPLHPKGNKPFLPLNAPLPQRPPFFPLNSNPQMPIAQASSNLEVEETDEDIEFFKQLVQLLELLPDSPTAPASSKMDSEIQMLQSFLLENQANLENAPANQLMQAGPLPQHVANMDNAFLYQQLNRSASNNPTAMVHFSPNLPMPMASVPQNAPLVENAQADPNLLMQMVELIQSRKPSANAPLSENQNLRNRECIERVSSAVIMEQPAPRNPYIERVPLTISRSTEEFGFEKLMAGKYESTTKSMGYRSNEPNSDLFADIIGKSTVYNRDWDEPSYSNIPKKGANRTYDDFSRVPLPPSIQRLENKRLQDISFERGLRPDLRSQAQARPNYSGHGSRPFDDPAWEDRERDMPYGKRAKLDSDFATRKTGRGERYPDERDAMDTGRPNLSADILKKIRGKDLFTVSAILSEFTDNNPYN